MAGEQPRALCGSSGAAGGAVGEETQPKGTKSLEESATGTRSHLLRRRGRARTPRARGRATGGAGAEEAMPALSASFSLCPWDGSRLPRARGHPPTERGEGLSPAQGAAHGGRSETGGKKRNLSALLFP